MTAEPQHQAVSASEAEQAFASLEPLQTVLIAVSGGPDSLALLYLLAEWAKRRVPLAPKLTAATVDHQLRVESAAEAAIVAEHCGRLGVPHTVLKWQQKPWSGLMAAARDARYELLARHLETIAGLGPAAVVTAHTLDDQAETLIMRLKRGSGVEGLAAIPARRAISAGSEIQLVRPLLVFAKTRLIATLQSRGIMWCDDPTNSDAHYERVRVRRLMQNLEQSGLTAAALARTADRMRDASEGLDYGYNFFKATLVLGHNGGMFATVDRKAFDAGPAILRQRVLRDLIALYCGTTPPPEMLEIENLSDRLRPHSEVRATLGGATISAGLRYVRVWRELGRIEASGLALVPGVRYLWDGRFRVGYDCDADAAGTGISLRPLGPAGFKTISAEIEANSQSPAAAIHGLPGFWADDTLLAVPVLGVVTQAGKSCAGLRLTCDPIAATGLDN